MKDRNPSEPFEGDQEPDDRTIVKGGAFVPSSQSQPQQAYFIVLNGASAGKMYKVTGNEMIVGRSANADILLTDDSVSRNHARINRVGNVHQISDLGSTNGTYCNGELVSNHVLNDGDKIQVGSSIILKFSYQDNLEEAYLKQLYESATKDGLTEIYNKKYFLNQLNYEFSFAQRKNVPLSLIVFDLDKFKTINDTYGHLAGDAVLKHVSRLVSSRIRSHDLFARYGGEEFVVLLRETEDAAAELLAERLRRHIEQGQVQYEGKVIPVSISVGVSSTSRRSFASPSAMIEAADMALYRSKQTGRNRVTLEWEMDTAGPVTPAPVAPDSTASAKLAKTAPPMPLAGGQHKTQTFEPPKMAKKAPPSVAPPAERPLEVDTLPPIASPQSLPPPPPPLRKKNPPPPSMGPQRGVPPGRPSGS